MHTETIHALAHCFTAAPHHPRHVWAHRIMTQTHAQSTTRAPPPINIASAAIDAQEQSAQAAALASIWGRQGPELLLGRMRNSRVGRLPPKGPGAVECTSPGNLGAGGGYRWMGEDDSPTSAPAGHKAAAFGAGDGAGAGSNPEPALVLSSPALGAAPATPPSGALAKGDPYAAGPASPTPTMSIGTPGTSGTGGAGKKKSRLVASIKKRQRKCRRVPTPPSLDTADEFALAYEAVSDREDMQERRGRQTSSDEEPLVGGETGAGGSSCRRGGASGRAKAAAAGAGQKKGRNKAPKAAAAAAAAAAAEEPEPEGPEGEWWRTRRPVKDEKPDDMDIGGPVRAGGLGAGPDPADVPMPEVLFGLRVEQLSPSASPAAPASPAASPAPPGAGTTGAGSATALAASGAGGGGQPGAGAGGGAPETRRIVFSHAIHAASCTSLVIDEAEEDGHVVTSVIWSVYR